jgi:MFS family permease
MAVHQTSTDQRAAVVAPPGVDGATGWLMAAATFASTFTVFGVAYSFGSFFGPMADEFGSDRSATALFFAITAFLYFGLGVVSGHIADLRGPRPVMLVGAVCLVVGLLATSTVQSIWLGYLTYGLGVGIGVACCYVPMVAAVGGWFQQRRTTALGVAVAGIGVGTLVVAPLTERLIEANGWRRTYVILAIGAAVILALTAAATRRPPAGASPPGHGADSPLARLLRAGRGSLGDRALRRDFAILYLSGFLITLALFVPFVFLPDYVDTEGVVGSAGWLIGAIGISSVAGRLGLGALATLLPSIKLYQGAFVVLGLSFGLWLVAGTSYPVLLAFTIVLGVAYGGFIALAPAVTADLFGTAGLGGVLGALYTSSGIGGLVGPPLMGLIIDRSGYRPALLSAMAFAVTGGALLSALGRAEAR